MTFTDGDTEGPRPAESDETVAADLLEDVCTYVGKYLVTAPAERTILALWVLHTWAIEAADSTPFIFFSSAEPGSGKTRAFETVANIVREPWNAIAPSVAVLFRKIEQKSPTLLLDEVDAIFCKKGGETAEGLRAILNAGNRRSTRVDRVEKKKGEMVLVSFGVFCPRALAGLGRPPRTIEDRSITFRMRPRLPHEPIARLRQREATAEARPIRDALATWSKMYIPELRAARPHIPDSVSDRMADACEPLLAIADLAGGQWPLRARAAIEQVAGPAAAKEPDLKLLLLADIMAAFGQDQPLDRLQTAELIRRLKDDPEGPWNEIGRGREGLTAHVMARLLADFRISSRTIRLPSGGTARGYLREEVAEEYARHRHLLSSPPILERHNDTNRASIDQNPLFEVTQEGVAGPQVTQVLANIDGPCVNVSDETAEGTDQAREWAPLPPVGDTPNGSEPGPSAPPADYDDAGLAELDPDGEVPF
jgi:Protein of unknown function (DUF3631)